jgi:HEAT repeat protein
MPQRRTPGPRAWAVAALIAGALVGPGAVHASDFDFAWLGKVELEAEGLASADHKERREAVAALATYDISLTKPHLLRALADSDRRVRHEAGRVLGKHGMVEITPAVIRWLEEPDAEVKKDAVEILGLLATDTAVSALVRTLGDVDEQVRKKAVEALGRVGTPAVLVPLIGRLDDDRFEVRQAAIEELERIGDARAMIPLVGAFDDTSGAVRKAAIRAVGRIGDAAATPALLRLLRDPDEDIRRAAVAALGNLAPVEATGELLAEFGQRHSDAYLAEVAYALSKIARRSAVPAAGAEPAASQATERALRVLVEALARRPLRAAAREALRNAGAVAVPALVAHLDGQIDGDPVTAVEILRDIHDPRATPALVSELERGRISRALVLDALEATGDRRALRPILGLLSTRDAPLRLRAMEALRPIADDVRAADILVELLGDPELEIRILAAEYLGLMRAHRAVPALLARIGPEQPPRLRLAAVDALGEIGAPEAVDALVDLLAHGPRALHAAAANALIYIGSPAPVAPLLALARDAQAPGQAQAMRSLGGILRGQRHEEVGELAVSLLQSEDLAVSLAAIEALGAMRDPAAAPALRRLLDADVHRRRAAITALGNLGDHASVPALIAALDAGDDRVSGDAAWALAKLADPRALDALARATRRRGWAATINATAALARLAPADHAEHLLLLLHHRERLVRLDAAWGLGRMQARSAQGALLTCLAEDASPLVRAACARALDRMPSIQSASRETAVLMALGRARDQDPDPRVRAAAQAVLSDASEIPARSEWRSFLIVDPDRDDLPVPQAAYFLLAPDGLVTAHYSDARGYVGEEQFPAGDYVLAPRSQTARY